MSQYPSQTKRKRAPRADARELSSIEAAAAFLNVHPRTVNRLIRRGELQAHRIRGTRLIKVDMREVYALAQPVPPESVAS